MKRWLSRLALEAVLIPCVLLAAWGAHRVNVSLQEFAVERAADVRLGPTIDGRVLNVASLGFERLVADLFWIRTVYYVGDEDTSKAGWPDAERLAMLVTDIDPHFDSVYVLMSSVLCGLRYDPDAAIRLLEKGAAVSRYWRIHFLLGFQYFMEKGDYVKGAKALERAMDLGGPHYLQFLVSRLYSHDGDSDTAIEFISARLHNEENPEVRQQLEKRLSDIRVDRDLKQIEAAIDGFRQKTGRTPTTIAELVAAGQLPSAPRDPQGGSYSISEGHAATSLSHEPMRLYKTRGEPKP